MKKYPLLFLALLASFFFASVMAAPPTDGWRKKVDTHLLALAEHGETVDFIVLLSQQADLGNAQNFRNKKERGMNAYQILQEIAAETQAPVIQVLKTAGATYKSFFVVNAIHSSGGLDLLKSLAELPQVAVIQANIPVRMESPVEEYDGGNRGPEAIEWGVERINADDVWGLGYTGQGVVVGGEDTGYDWTHPALKPKYRGYNPTTDIADHNYNWHDAIHEINPLNNDSIPDPANNPCGVNSPVPCDDNSHGTHTMGTMVGSEGDNQIGVAPDAQWCACRNMERGWGTPATYIECFEWFIAPTDLNGQNPDPAKAPHVINNSWSCPPQEGCDSLNIALMQTVVNNVKASGIVVVVSAGNSGSQGCGSVSTPAAIYESSFSVGATAQNDTIAGFSSRGPVTVDGSMRLKPNVSAPGVGTRSAVPNGGYGVKSGTSMAGPHVAGLVALVISANPELAGQVEIIETIIEATAVPKTTDQECGGIPGSQIPNNTYGFGRVDALAAVNAALALISSDEEQVVDNELVKVFPNPFQNSFTFDFGNLKGAATIEIFNAAGALVERESLDLTNNRLVKMDLPGVAAGLFFYKINHVGGSLQGRLVKVK